MPFRGEVTARYFEQCEPGQEVCCTCSVSSKWFGNTILQQFGCCKVVNMYESKYLKSVFQIVPSEKCTK